MRISVGGADAPLHRVERGSAHLVARELRKGFGEGTVLDGVSLTVSAGQCLAVVGDNGVGKSTLLRLLAGTLRPDAGSVMCTTTRTLVEQELDIAAGSTVADVRAAATRSAREALLALEDASVALADDHPDAAERYAAALADAERLDAWDAQRRLAEALDAFGATFPGHARLHELSVPPVRRARRSPAATAPTGTRAPRCSPTGKPDTPTASRPRLTSSGDSIKLGRRPPNAGDPARARPNTDARAGRAGRSACYSAVSRWNASRGVPHPQSRWRFSSPSSTGRCPMRSCAPSG